MPTKKLAQGIPLGEIARYIGASLRGPSNRLVNELVPIEDARPNSLSFVRGISKAKLSQRMQKKNIGAVIIASEALSEDSLGETSLLIVANPLAAVIKIIPLFFDPVPVTPGISPKADIDPSAQIGSEVSIGAFTTVGAFAKIEDGATLHPHVVVYPGARIGARSVLHSNVTVREDCTVGPDSIIQNGAVIGADGFGYVPDPELGLRPVPQIGNVVLAPRVDIGANTCIDRATLGSTKIDLGTKIDNLVQIGHNTVIGQHSIVCGQVGIAGSVTVGNNVVFGGNVGVRDHVTIADGCRFAAKSGVIGDITKPGDYAGFPTVSAQQFRRCAAALRKLPDVLKKLRAKNVQAERDADDDDTPRVPPFVNGHSARG